MTNLLIDTDHPLDKVIYMKSGSVSVGGYNYNDITIAHGLPFAPLVSAIYSTSSSFPIAWEYNSGEINTSATAPSPFRYDTRVVSDSSNITIRHTNNMSSTVTLYYRLYGFMPSTANDLVGFTDGIADDFVVNSDWNYTKLLLAGATAWSSADNSTVTVNHGLGYRPQVEAWVETGTGIYKRTFTDAAPNGTSYSGAVEVGTNTVVFRRSAGMFGNSSRFHYRIYVDE